ncbi:TPA: hypothetical protein DD449_05390 [Candidatus Berkelbacteria bacterium]|uniref:Uncharacterized protein n=1 Tax=Berkelbacteria bacterium GW2011_GWE1_39_12 TaxID=1618337 RepID=A0A0G4B3G8_9BACT|nr:MAG: hypothetical protein UT28_C0001G0151 [Berkelbacteria bacterium GW2011_GWE1_39_12]HBO61077.1 hypothetical protein [Candidatus Berkelbacteria bacterium]
MNQPQIPGEQSPMQPAQPAVSKWLWITLIIVVLIAGGYFAWYYLSGPGKTASTTTVTTTPATTNATTTPTTTTTTTATSATADWKTYAGKYEGLTLQYPSTWKLVTTDKTINDYKGSGLTGPFENFTLTSPNNYIIKYTTHIDGLGGGCDVGENCPKTFFYNVLSMVNANFTNLQLVQIERRDQNNTTVKSREIALWSPSLNTTAAYKTGDNPEGIFYSMYSDKGVDKTLSQLSGGFVNEDGYLKMTMADYFNQADVKEAASILKTVTFK